MQGQDTAEIAVFVEDGDFMDAVFAEDVDDFHDVHRFGNINRLVDALFDDGRQGDDLILPDGGIVFLEDFADGNHADEIIQRAPADGQSIVVKGYQFLHHRFFRVFDIDPIDLGPVGHDITDVHVGQAEDAVYQFRFFFFKGPQFDALFQEQFDFIFRNGQDFRFIDAHDLRDHCRRPGQDPYDRCTEDGKVEHRPGQEAGDFFRLVDGDALGHDFAEDNRQIGDEGDDTRQADRIGIIFQSRNLGDVFRQGSGHFRAPVDTGEQADQGNAELDHGKHLIRIFTKFQDNSG